MMISRVASRFLLGSLKHPCKRLTGPVLPRFIKTGSYLLSVEDDTPANTSVAETLKDDVISNINKQAEQAENVEENFNYDELLLKSAESGESWDVDDIDNSEFEHSDTNIRDQILSVALENVPLYGWSMKSIETAVEALGLSSASTEMFEREGLDLVLYFIEEANKTLIEYIVKEAQVAKLNTEEAQFAFIENALKTRLQMIIPYLESWPQALQLMASPLAAKDVFENGANLMDEICYHAGDLDTDITWYAKRAALAGISASTELYMLNDQSLEYRDTWIFLHRRLRDARALNDAKDSLNNVAGDTIALVNAGIATAQNVLGLGSKK